MGDRIDFSKQNLWRLPDDIKKRVVKHKTPSSKEEGEISKWIAIALARLDTHDEMRDIAKQIHPSTEYKPFNKAITAYKKTSEDTKKDVREGKIPIMRLIRNGTENKRISKEDQENWILYKNAKKVQDQLNLFYKNLKVFLDGTPEDRKYLKEFLKPQKIHYIASLLSCIRNEELLKSFKKQQGIKSLEEFRGE